MEKLDAWNFTKKHTFCPSKRSKSLHVDGRLWCGAGSAECGVD
jgi:hypothetical protein